MRVSRLISRGHRFSMAASRVECRPMAAHEHFDFTGTYVVIELVRLRRDCTFGLDQCFSIASLVRQESREAADDFRIAALLAEKAFELHHGLGRVAPSPQRDGEVGTRLPEICIQFDGSAQTAAAFLELAHFQQQIAEVGPAERQSAVHLSGPSRQIHGGLAIGVSAEKIGVRQ